MLVKCQETSNKVGKQIMSLLKQPVMKQHGKAQGLGRGQRFLTGEDAGPMPSAVLQSSAHDPGVTLRTTSGPGGKAEKEIPVLSTSSPCAK